MKIGLIVAAVAVMAGCGARSVPVSVTTLSNATLTPSTLAPAAWDGEQESASSSEAVPTATWGGKSPATSAIAAPATATVAPAP